MSDVLLQELKPCPFCGNKAEYKSNKRYRGGIAATVGCSSCAAKMQQATLKGTVIDAYGHAGRAWNKRVND